MSTEKTQAFEASADGPDRVGPYRVLETLGQGGMGVVYLASQEKPVRRRVALKLIKLGMDTQAVLARFESEREALALMDHRNIAQVLDAGTSENGRPFFVMEYIKGMPLTDYCDRNRLSTEQRLDLFLQVCAGVGHAHSKGIIHRDLKPTNILVTEKDNRPVAKVIDFGLAKATEQKLTDKTIHTVIGTFLGTPAYMSPEQIEPTGLGVDTRSDIYALGIILYELLVGERPFDLTEAVRMASQREIRRIICEENPQRPSTRASGFDDERARAIAKERAADPDALVKKLRGDLDWIVLKALDKSPSQRYETAAELRADIERHLSDDPVLACPPSKIYRLGKFARKHKGWMIGSGAVATALILGLIVSTGLYLTSEEQRRQADAAKTLAQEKTSVAERERRRAEEKEREAERQRDEILRLADIKRLSDYDLEADNLWPAEPKKVPAFRSWLDKADELAARLPGHLEDLEVLRSEAESRGDGEERRFYFGGDVERQWRHDALTDLTLGLKEFVAPEAGTIASVRRRLAFASTVSAATIERYAPEWTEAIASIRDECPQYRGLVIKPQIGLIPLGRDAGSGLWEFAHIQSGDIAEREADGGLLLTEETGLVLVLVPGGTFWMGAQRGNPNRQNFDGNALGNEGAVHEVTLDPFFLSKFEMIQAQWRRIAHANPSRYGAHDYGSRWDRTPARQRRKLMGLHPVEQVSWEDCRDLMRRLGLVLPTEAQWEYAARAGTATVFWTGDHVTSLDGAANLADAYGKAHGAPPSWTHEKDLNDGYTVHAPVGRFKANPFGFHDILGNVWEWCQDGYGAYAIPVNPGDGKRLVEGARSRVNRGGGFDNTASNSRCAARSSGTPDARLNFLGLRPARAISD